MPGLRILVTSGPTVEPLDPVRYLSNRSTGTLGRCVVDAAKRRGHKVTWIQCPQDAQTARDLLQVLKRQIGRHDVLFMSAAVCDVRPEKQSSGKLKKQSISVIKFVKNPDILATLAAGKKKSQFFVGFGIESKSVLAEGQRKLKAKGLDAIVMQKVTGRISPFGAVKVNATLILKDGEQKQFLNMSKPRLALGLVSAVERLARWPRS